MSDAEKIIKTRTDELASYLTIEPPVDTFEQYLGVCAAAYGAVYGEDYYQRETAPKPNEEDFEKSTLEDLTVIKFGRTVPYKLDHAGVKVVEEFEHDFGIKAEYENLADAA